MSERFVRSRVSDSQRPALIRLDMTADVAAATARLARRSSEALAAFIISLAQMNALICEHVIDFIAADDPVELGTHLRAHLQRLRKEGGRGRRTTQGASIAIRLESILDSIEEHVLPVNAEEALELLALVIECDGDAMEQCGDAHYEVGLAINRACTLAGIAAASLPPEPTRQTLQRLLDHDDYDCRRPLAAVIEGLPGGNPA